MSISDCIALLGRHEERIFRTNTDIRPSRVRKLLATLQPLTPAEVRRAAAVAFFAARKARNVPFPKAVTQAIHADYLALGPTKAGRKWGMSRDMIWRHVVRENLPVIRKRHDPRVHGGRTYYRMPDGTYRNIKATPRALHQSIWVEANGPIQTGHKIGFINGKDAVLSNLVLLTNSEAARRAVAARDAA